MQDILISIKPCFVERICKLEKKFEYRKTEFKKPIDRVYIYATAPVGKIVGYFPYCGAIHGRPEKVWEKTHNHSGIDKIFFEKYFLNKEDAYAIIIKDLVVFTEMIDPLIVFKKFTAPQSYMYIREGEVYEKLRCLV